MIDKTNKSTESNAGEPALNRRRLLKVAVATAPIIATLPSGAALARSSNLIRPASAWAARDARDRTLCLDRNSGQGYSNGAVDLGVPPSGNVNAIVDRTHRLDDRWSAAQVSEADMCKNGGSYYHYANGSWKKVTVPRGILVSGTALSSFVGSIVVKEI
jgi:hypothetical protein